MGLLNKYSTDHNKIEDGVKMPLGDAFFIISYFNSTKCRLYLETKAKIYSKLYPMEQVNQMVLHETLINLVVLGWENLKEKKNPDEEETLVEYSKEELKRLLIEYPGLDIDLMELSGRVELFKKEDAESTKGK